MARVTGFPYARGNGGWFLDYDNVLARFKNKDTTEDFQVDFMCYVAGDTGFDFTFSTTGNITATQMLDDAFSVDYQVTGSNGVLTVTATGNPGTDDRVFVQSLRFYDTSV